MSVQLMYHSCIPSASVLLIFVMLPFFAVMLAACNESKKSRQPDSSLALSETEKLNAMLELMTVVFSGPITDICGALVSTVNCSMPVLPFPLEMGALPSLLPAPPLPLLTPTQQ